MTNRLTLDLSKQIKRNNFQVVDVSMVDADPLLNGQTAHIKTNIFLPEIITCFSTRLLIFDTEWKCAFASSFKTFDTSFQGRYCIDFYFLANLESSQYLATFEFVRKKELLQDKEDFENILGRYNSFVEFAVIHQSNDGVSELDIKPQGYTHLPFTATILGTSEKVLQPTHKNRIGTTGRMPWPNPSAQISLSDLSEALKEILPAVSLTTSDSIRHRWPFSPNSYDRKFPAGQLPMRSQMGVAEGPGLRSNGLAGFLLFGPYLSAMPGRYEAIFEGRTGAVIGNNPVVFDVAAKQGLSILSEEKVNFTPNESFSIRVEFEISSPGVVDLELRTNIFDKTDILLNSVTLTSLLKKSARSTHKIEDIILSSSKDNATGQFSKLLSAEGIRRSKTSKLVLIFVPNEAFTICGLVLAHHLLRKSNSKTILVSDGPFSEAISISIMKICGINECVLLKNIQQELSSLMVDTLVTHAENSLLHTKTLLKELSKNNRHVELHAYSDGFRNAANLEKLTAFHPIDKLYFFGMPDFSAQSTFEVPSEIIDFQTSQRVLTRFAQAHNFIAHEPLGLYKHYSIFCLRYWGLEGYNFPSQLVGESWYKTICAHTSKEELIIIKAGGGHAVNGESYASLKDLLTKNGYAFMDADDYLISCGMPAGSSESSLEYLLYSGMFRQATRFFSLDSSVPIILAQLDYLNRPVEIVCGANNLQHLNIYSGFQVIKRNLSQLRKTFENAPFFDPFEVIEEDSTCFTVKLI